MVSLVYLVVGFVLCSSVRALFQQSYLGLVPTSYYSEPFYPPIIKKLDGEHYYIQPEPHITEKRIRHVKLDQYLIASRSAYEYKKTAFLSHQKRDTFLIESDPFIDGKRIEVAFNNHTCLSSIPYGKHLFLGSQPCTPYLTDPIFRWSLHVDKSYGYSLIEQTDTGYCLQPEADISFPTRVGLVPCDPLNEYQYWDVNDAYLYYK